MTQEEFDTLANEFWLQGCEFGRMAEREKEKKRQLSDIHSCGPDCDRYICVAVRKARQEEREACAKVCDELAARDKLSNYYKVAANAIRARGQK